MNKIAFEADLLVAEGFIEPHFFAGFSGGRKSVLSGIASRGSVLANHCSEFVEHKRSRTGIIEGNPIHEDMLWAAKTARLEFIVNVVLNSEKKVIYVSEMPDETVEKMHMIPAHSLDEALLCARKLPGRKKIKIVAIPEGISVIVKE